MLNLNPLQSNCMNVNLKGFSSFFVYSRSRIGGRRHTDLRGLPERVRPGGHRQVHPTQGLDLQQGELQMRNRKRRRRSNLG